MKWLISVIALLFIYKSFAQNITTGAGVAVHIKQEMFDNLKDTVIKKFIDSIETGNLTDIKIVKDVKFFKILLDMTEMKLRQFHLNLNDSFLRLRDQDPHLELFVSNFSVNFTFDFNLRSDPAFVEDKGNGRIEFQPTSLYIGYEIKIANGKPYFVTKSAVMNCTDVNIYANGTADFFKSNNSTWSIFKGLNKNVVDATITPAINNMISSSFAAVYNINNNIVANFTSTVNPLFFNDHMTLFFKGEVTPNDEPKLPFADKLQVPSSTKPDGKYIQIALSDYIFNSTLYSLYQKKYLQINTKNINGTENPVPISYFYLLFPSLEGKYPADTPVWFKAVAMQDVYKPYMEISNKTATAYADFEIEMSASQNPQTLLRLSTSVQAGINFYINKGFKLTVDIQKLKFRLKKILENNIDPTLDERDISAFIGFISGFLRNYVNTLVKNLEISLPISDVINLKECELGGLI